MTHDLRIGGILILMCFLFLGRTIFRAIEIDVLVLFAMASCSLFGGYQRVVSLYCKCCVNIWSDAKYIGKPE